MFTVVPALTMSFAPSATVTSPLRFMVPDQVSVPEIIPDFVSFTADAAGKVTSPVSTESNNSATNDMLLCDVVFFKIDTSLFSHLTLEYNTAPYLPF